MNELQIILVNLKATLVLFDDIPTDSANEAYLEAMYGKIEECIDMATGIVDGEPVAVKQANIANAKGRGE
jgi:hypothetical protein